MYFKPTLGDLMDGAPVPIPEAAPVEGEKAKATE